MVADGEPIHLVLKEKKNLSYIGKRTHNVYYV